MMKVVMAFVIGGGLCVLAQLVLDLGRVTPAHVLVGAVVIGAILSGFGLYSPLVHLGGAGATVPLLGFGHSLVQGVLRDFTLRGWPGLLTGGFSAAAVGLSTVIILATLAALVTRPKRKY
ncbi:MAG TPA: SpoVA/SpoVAEb family sporulation membrane protein [Bacillota bacterium]|jgi:stage V sporulation protein AE